MIKRTYTVDGGSGDIALARDDHHTDAVSLRQGSDYILLETLDEASEVRDALAQLIEEMMAE